MTYFCFMTHPLVRENNHTKFEKDWSTTEGDRARTEHLQGFSISTPVTLKSGSRSPGSDIIQGLDKMLHVYKFDGCSFVCSLDRALTRIFYLDPCDLEKWVKVTRE